MKRYIKNSSIYCLFLIFLLAISINTNAQKTEGDTINIEADYKLEKDVTGDGGDDEDELPIEQFNVEFPPSPAAAIFKDYSNEVSVDLFTGAPTLSVPICVLNNGNTAHSVSLSYSSNGISVSQTEQYGKLGLSCWSLSAGGVINRTVRGVPDDHPAGYIFNTAAEYAAFDIDIPLTSYAQPALFFKYETNQLDFEPDVFSFSVNGVSGSFYFTSGHSVNETITSEDIVLIPKQNIKIEPLINPSIEGWYRLEGFIITTEDGYRHTFQGKVEKTQTWTPDTHELMFYNSAWYLTEIKSPYGKIEFEFEYFPLEIEHNRTWSYAKVFKREDDGGSARRYSTTGSVNIIRQEVITNTWYLEKIIGRNQTVKFNYTEEEQDLFFIENIKIYNNKNLNTPITQFNIFVQSYYYFYILESIQETAGNISKPPYLFEYYPYYEIGDTDGINPSNVYFKNGIDFWGFYNGIVNKSLISRTTLYGYNFGNVSTLSMANRNHNLEYNKTLMLKKVIFPTNGYTTLEYDSHRFKVKNACDLKYHLNTETNDGKKEVVGGGVRVSVLNNFDGDNKFNTSVNFESSA